MKTARTFSPTSHVAPLTNSSRSSISASVIIQAADGPFHVPGNLAAHLGLGEKLTLPVSTQTLKFAVSTLTPYPLILPLHDSFLDDLLILAEHGFGIPAEYVSGKLEEVDPLRAFVLDVSLQSIKDSDLQLQTKLDTYFAGYDGDSSHIDSWCVDTLAKYAPKTLPQLEKYLANLPSSPTHELTLEDDGYGQRGFGYGGRSGFGTAPLDEGELGYDRRYHAARW